MYWERGWGTNTDILNVHIVSYGILIVLVYCWKEPEFGKEPEPEPEFGKEPEPELEPEPEFGNEPKPKLKFGREPERLKIKISFGGGRHPVGRYYFYISIMARWNTFMSNGFANTLSAPLCKK